MNDLKSIGKFCPLLYNHICTNPDNTFKFCCEAISPNETQNSLGNVKTIFNSKYYNKIRIDHLNGVENYECNSCWEKERKGFISKRLYEIDEIEYSSYYSNEDFSNKINFLQSYKKSNGWFPSYVQLQLKNKCNHACLMCNSFWSDYFHKIIQKSPVLVERYDGVYGNNSNSDFEFWKSLYKNYEKITHLYVTGGEPFIISELWEFLDFLIEKNHAKNVQFICCTNGSALTSEKIKKLSKFNDVDINLSIDGYGKLNEILRLGSKWTHLEKNVKYCKNNTGENFKFNIVPAIHGLNLDSIHLLFDWFINLNFNKFKIRPNVLEHPIEMHVNAVNFDIEKIRENLQPFKELSCIEHSSFYNLNNLLENHVYNRKLNQRLKEFLKNWNDCHPCNLLEYFSHLFTKENI